MSGATASAAALLGGPSPAGATTTLVGEPPPTVYTRLGARPFINGTATLTRNGGSRLLPEVIKAIHHASHYHVRVTKLLEAAGDRISKLLGVEWALVTSGAASALACATAACVAGTNPEHIVQLPDLSGLKNEVIMPKWSRNFYDHSIRMVGVDIIEVETVREFREAINHHTAMAAVLGDRFGDPHPNLADIAPIARQYGIPLLVDAAADFPVVPNPYIALGADMVVYSGGKIIRGPQTAGLLLGREKFVRGAALHAFPRHSIGRPMKVSKEEIAGMVAAVEVWVRDRDIEAEYREWEGWYEHISRQVKKVDGVSSEVRPPSRGGPFPTLKVSWDTAKIGLTGSEMHRRLLGGDPAIMVSDTGDTNYFILRPVALKPDEYTVIAERAHSILRAAPRGDRRPAPSPPAADLSGHWDVAIAFQRGKGSHKLFLETDGNIVHGTHIGALTQGEIRGTIDGDQVRLKSVLPFEGAKLKYTFTGKVNAGSISGELDLNEYPAARFTAERHDYGRRSRRDPSRSG